MSTVEIKRVGLLSDEEVEKLKAEHEVIYEIEVTRSETETSVAYLRKMDRNVFAVAMMRNDQNLPLEAGEHIKTNCFVAGDKRLLSDDINDEFSIKASMLAYGAVKLPAGTFKKK